MQGYKGINIVFMFFTFNRWSWPKAVSGVVLKKKVVKYYAKKLWKFHWETPWLTTASILRKIILTQQAHDVYIHCFY